MEQKEAMMKQDNFVVRGIKNLWKDHGYVFALIVLLIFATIASPQFMTQTNIFNILRQTSIVGIIALGMTFVIILGGIDLSVGSVLAVCGVIILLLQNANVPIFLSILAGCGVGMAIGAANGFIIAKAKLAPFIVTLATMTIARSLVIFLSDGSSIIGDASSDFTVIGNGKLGPIPIRVIIFLGAILVCHFALQKTKFGRYVFSVGGSETTAVYSGIKVDKTKILTYMLIGLTVAIASVIETARLASVSSASSGLYYEMDAIAAVIIGGTPLTGGKGTIIGTVVGIIILGIIGNIMNLMNISPYLNGAVKGIIILIAVLLQKRGK